MSTLTSITTNILLLFGLVLLLNQGNRVRLKKALRTDLFYGVIIGFITVIIMLNAWEMQEGVFFDTRSVMIGATALFFSGGTAIIAAIIASIFRIFSGGPGTFVGVLTILSSLGVGMLWRHYVSRKWKFNNLLQYYVFGLIIHIVMLATFLLLPSPTNIKTIQQLGPIIILTYPLATMFLCLAIKNHDERVKAHQMIEFSEKRYRSLINNSDVGIIQFNTDGIIELTNEAFASMLHTTKKDLIGLNMMTLPNQDVVKALKECLNGNNSLFEGMYQSVLSFHIFPVRTRFSPIIQDGAITGGIGIIENLTKEYEHQEQLKNLRLTDSLTKLRNRLAFDQLLNSFTIKDNHLPLTIITCDINMFRIINTSFGYDVGNQVLITIANYLKDYIENENPYVFRIEGDQFVLLLSNTDHNDAEKISLELKRGINNFESFDFSINTSFGYYTIDSSDESLTKGFNKAEKDLQTKKIYDDSSISKKTIDVIMTTLFAKSKRERDHSERVSQLSRRIAKDYKNSPSFVNRVTLAAKLHDIGKINISNDVLDKTEKLSNDEYKHIKNHPESGYRILSAVPEYAQIANIVLAHHERPDGKGYPQGLSHNDIPLEARIIAVADAFDAMVNDRPYRSKLTTLEALEELKSNQGTQFDKDIVEAFIKTFQKPSNS
ncbi:MAG: HD domain-containing phosphohydrolase [Candidatus Izemoplasma sp.]|nr:HD domain-containing phosphohydrolase [Candidatus Izemoplasma sp.]